MTERAERFVFEIVEPPQPDPALGKRRAHRKGITVPVARKRLKTTPWSETMRFNQSQARQNFQRGNPFMVWDGEGVTNLLDGTMDYVLLGHTAPQDSRAPTYITDTRLTTMDLLDFIWEEGNKYPWYYHVGFGFNFDVDQILRDIPDELIAILKKTNTVDWRGYRIFFIPRKIFSISYKNARKRVTIYDTISFFNTNLINTARQYVPDESLIEVVAKGKAGRSSFEYSELDSIIIPYWEREGVLMAKVMNALRHSLIGAGIKLEKWHGPGAIAEALIKRQGLLPHLQESNIEMPNQVVDATAFAFFGGRFENFIMGDIQKPIYSYDIRSAYPYGLTMTKSLSGGHWKQTLGKRPNIKQKLNGKDWTTRLNEQGIYHVKWRGHPRQAEIGMGPLPYRDKHGLVSFPFYGEGWYFGPEIMAAEITGWELEFLESWEYVNGEPSPFAFLLEMYLQRIEFKREGNPAQLACKLGPNSIYGKLAQLVGWNEETFEPPKFHHQWYAGMTTSYTRAILYMAMMQKPYSIIACETDGIYSLEPLDLSIGPALGEWEVETYERMLYVQSGMYFAFRDGEWIKARTRGISKGNVTANDALDALPTLRAINSVSHRYGSLTGSLGSEKRFKWYDQESTVEWGHSEKRRHKPGMCDRCVLESRGMWTPDNPFYLPGDVHFNVVNCPMRSEMSTARLIPWLDGRMFDFEGDEDEDMEDIYNGLD